MTRMPHRWRLLAASSVVALLVAACGGGAPQQNGDGGNGGDGLDAALQRFCEAVVDAEALVVAEGPEAEGLDPLLTEVEETAPEEVAEDVSVVVAGVRAAAEDPSQFDTPEFGEADEGVDQYVIDNCGYEVVEVSGTEYAFDGVPETLPAGRVAFNFSNDGEELHEMVVFRINDDVDLSFREILDLPQQEAETMMTFVGAGFGPPGETDGEVIELEPGRYGMSCFVPVGSTDPETPADGPPHFAEGMFAEFTVEQ